MSGGSRSRRCELHDLAVGTSRVDFGSHTFVLPADQTNTRAVYRISYYLEWLNDVDRTILQVGGATRARVF